MCPFCKDKPCQVVEQSSGKLVCECGKHSWPSSGVYAEACRKASLTVGKMVQVWTQSY